MEEVNFWFGREYIAYAIVNGLIGSVALWSFWTPFITFLALPVASATMKQAICNGINVLPSAGVLSTTAGTAGRILAENDPDTLSELNQGNTISLWLLAGLCITVSLWIASSIIKDAKLDINHVIKLNVILFAILVTIELGFFVGVGLKFIPFNLQNVYDDTISGIIQDMTPYSY